MEENEAFGYLFKYLMFDTTKWKTVVAFWNSKSAEHDDVETKVKHITVLFC